MSEKAQKRSSKKKARPKTVFEFSGGGVVRRLPVKEAIDALPYDSDRKLVETAEAGL